MAQQASQANQNDCKQCGKTFHTGGELQAHRKECEQPQGAGQNAQPRTQEQNRTTSKE